ncbi:hypothetical protein [Demequina sp. NBRC 110051]|uniref:hypothetical protein n=1 Tax=Demequina sp. NBRC 110051 TaxID=1570340 RepID=UPI000A0680AE|nr:hypothetical protein [Demequina sp. NBRC 110051]
MAHDKANGDRAHGSLPWHGINDDSGAVAPSKPAFPSTGSTPVVPREVPGEDGDIIAPVAQPDSEEIHPSSGTWEVVDAPHERAAADHGVDPVRELGDSAVRQASLSASGAIPRVTPQPASTAPTTFQPEDGVAPQPAWFAGDPRSNAPASAASWAATSAAYTPEVLPDASEALPDAAVAAAVDDDRAVAEPADDIRDDGGRDDEDDATASDWSDYDEGDDLETDDTDPADTDAMDADPDTAPGADGDDDGTVPPPPADEHHRPWYLGAAFLTIVGLVVLGAVAYVVYLLVNEPEKDVEIAAPVVVEVPAESTVEPIALDNPTDFLAAMPATVGVYGMSGATPVEEDTAGLDTRVAEVDDLTYTDGETTLELRAIQHYDEADATAQFDTLAANGSDPQPVTVGDAEVGQRVTIDGDPASYVWRNGTAVFVLTGPADALEEFWIQFPL